MTTDLPKNAFEFMDWRWERIAPYYQELADRHLDEKTVSGWLADWSHLGDLIHETHQRLWVATSVNTVDQVAEERYNAFLDHIYPQAQAADQKLKEKLLASGLEPDGFERPLRNMRSEAAIFREANLPLLSEQFKLGTEYDKIIGAQTVAWEGQELTLIQLQPVYQDPEREKRERAWRLAAERQLADRAAINDLWVKFMGLRGKLAENADLPDFRTYRWQQLLRHDYTPEDCKQFQQAIEQVAVPAAQRIYERRRKKLGLASLRPWDLNVDVHHLPPLRPFERAEELESRVASMFNQVDAQLGEYFEVMRRERLLDLENRKNKAPGGFCSDFPFSKRPFIFMNAVGLHDDVQTLVHEGGHAFHTFEAARLPYMQQREVGIEFAEVASMGMELLASPFLPAEKGGFYSDRDAARARTEFLEFSILFLPYMAVVDAFQHWVYENHAAASQPEKCDAKWAELWGRYMLGVDWSGLEQEMVTGWQRKGHIHQDPFYYVEYGLALLGALQVWRNAMKDQAGAVAAYRKALALGGTVSIPQLYAAVGAKFAFDAGTLGDMVEMSESKLEELEAVILD
jgi:oligoendopeptidase F